MQRQTIASLHKRIGEEVKINGQVHAVRDLGSVSFIVVQDYTGSVQTVWDSVQSAKTGDAVAIIGIVKKENRAKSGVEMQGKECEIISAAVEDYPFDLFKDDINVNLNTLLDFRTLTVRNRKVQAIFKLYDLLLAGYGCTMRTFGFIEIKTPKFLEAASEGGANFFKVQYFDKFAYLAQSPQFYKQIMVGAFERVFEIGSTFRAEPHFTTRHVNEYISLDGEMGFIQNFRNVTVMLTKVLQSTFGHIASHGQEFLQLYNAEVPVVPDEIPHYTLADIKKIITKKYKYIVPEDTDIDPEGERLAGRFVKEEHNCDFVFITHYPMKYRPFYTMPDAEKPEEAAGFDLLFKGMEIATGSQRIHLYDMLISQMEKKGVKPDGMEFYLNTFKFAMPPHGGWGMGSERLIQQILGLGSIKEAVLFPRDVKRLSP